MDNFKLRAAISLLSSYTSEFATTAAGLATKLIIARLIAPKDLGVYSLALLVLMGCDLFIDFGVSQHLTRETHRPYGNVLLLRTVIATILFGLIQLFSKVTAFWGADLPLVLRVISVVMIVKAVSWVPVVYIERELMIHRSILPQFARLFLTGAVSIYLAHLHWGVWALVYGAIGEAIFGIAIWRAAWGRIPLEFTWKHSWKLVHGARFLFLIAVLGFILSQGGVAIIGAVLNSRQVGYYTMALSLIVMISKVIEAAIYRVIYPMFCEYKHNIATLGKIYRQATLAITAVEAPIYFYLLFHAPTVVSVLLGRKWMPAAILMQALSISGVINPFSTFGTEVLRARGHDRMLTLATVLNSLVFIGCGYFLTRRYGAIGMVAANYVIIGSIPVLVSVYRILKSDFRKLAGQLAVVYIISFLAISLVSLSLSGRPYTGAIAASLLMPICWYTYYRIFGDNIGSRTVGMLLSSRKAAELKVES